MASTAVSIDAYAVMTTIFIQGLPESSAGIRSSPLVAPRRRSTNAMWNVRRADSATASWKLPTAATRWPSASRQMERAFRMFPSSSTTRMFRGEPACVRVVMGPSSRCQAHYSMAASDIQRRDVQGVLLDELAARLDLVAHQAGEDLVGVGLVPQLHAQQIPGLR